jgi:hypothetical protein
MINNDSDEDSFRGASDRGCYRQPQPQASGAPTLIHVKSTGTTTTTSSPREGEESKHQEEKRDLLQHCGEAQGNVAVAAALQ